MSLVGDFNLRVVPSKKMKLSGANFVYKHMKEIAHLDQEIFFLITTTSKNRVLGIDIVAIGGKTQVIIDMGILFRRVLSYGGVAGIVLVHNHPSGDPVPSRHDIELTKNVRKSADMFSIKLMDHVIIAGGTYFSFTDEEII